MYTRTISANVHPGETCRHYAECLSRPRAKGQGRAIFCRPSIPPIRTGKVRIEVANPGMMKVGMFVTATFHGLTEQSVATVPASAALHPCTIATGSMCLSRTRSPPQGHGGRGRPSAGVNMQEIISGIPVGQQVVINPAARCRTPSTTSNRTNGPSENAMIRTLVDFALNNLVLS